MSARTTMAIAPPPLYHLSYCPKAADQGKVSGNPKPFINRGWGPALTIDPGSDRSLPKRKSERDFAIVLDRTVTDNRLVRSASGS